MHRITIVTNYVIVNSCNVAHEYFVDNIVIDSYYERCLTYILWF